MATIKKLNRHDSTSAMEAFELPNRRPSHILNTPALVAHYVFWYSPDHPNWQNAVDLFQTCEQDYVTRVRAPIPEDEVPTPRQIVGAALNAYLQKFKADGSGGISFQTPLFTTSRSKNDETIRLERTRAAESDSDPSVAVDRTLALSGTFGPYTLEITADIYYEHFSISFRLFPMGREGHTDGPAPPNLTLARKILNDLVSPNAGDLELVRNRESDCDLPDHLKEQLSDLRGLKAADAQANYWIDTIYENVWTELFAELDAAQPPQDKNLPTSFDPAKCIEQAWFPADLAGVFRNLIIRTMPTESQQAYQSEHDKVQGAFNVEGDRSLVLRHVPGGVLGHVNERAELALDGFARDHNSNPHSLIRARVTEHINHRSVFFGRLLGFRASSRWIEDLQSGNATLSLMLDGLAVHGSTLGLHTAGIAKYPHQEIRHFVVYGGPSRQQLGRLSRELHAVGEYRLLALRGYRALNQATQALEGLLARTGQIDVLLQAGRPKHAITLINQISHELQDLKSSIPEGGLVHRLIQPKNSLNHLMRHLAVLRLARVEGWRPYNEFVSRSVEPHVSYLQLAQELLDELEESLRSYEARATTNRNAKLTAEIKKVVEEIDDLQKEQASQGKKIVGLTYIAAASGITAAAVPIALAGFTGQAADSMSNSGLFFGGIGFTLLGVIALIAGIRQVRSSGK